MSVGVPAATAPFVEGEIVLPCASPEAPSPTVGGRVDLPKADALVDAVGALSRVLEPSLGKDEVRQGAADGSRAAGVLPKAGVVLGVADDV